MTHTTRKALLDSAELDFKEESAAADFAGFARDIDRIGRVDIDAMSLGKWKKLYAMLCVVGRADGKNYRIYRNAHGVCFDVTQNFMGTLDEMDMEADAPEKPEGETDAERLARWSEEARTLGEKIAHLTEMRRKLVEGRIAPLRAKMAAALEKADAAMAGAGV